MESLKSQFNKNMKSLEKQVKRYPWQDPHAYAMWLRNSYEYAYNSTRILALAAGLMPRNFTELSNRFIKHAAEEKGHEKLLESDIKNLGFDMHSLKASHEMNMFYQSLYYWLSAHAKPMGILGWVLALEGLAVTQGSWIYSQCKEAHGAKAAMFLKIHSAEDPDHLEKAFQAISKLETEDKTIVELALNQYSTQYSLVLQSVISESLDYSKAG